MSGFPIGAIISRWIYRALGSNSKNYSTDNTGELYPMLTKSE